MRSLRICSLWVSPDRVALEGSPLNEIILMSLRATITVSLFALFIALIFWAWSPKRHKEFAEAANLVFDEPDRVPTEPAPANEKSR
jgi:cbb3-type cytochrome oxidase subunit 3